MGWSARIGAAMLATLLVFAFAAYTHPQAAKFQLVVGETYLVVVDCLPAFAAPPNTNPCYVERLTVKAISDDGWFDAVDPADGKDAMVWRVNVARVYAITKVATPNRRSV